MLVGLVRRNRECAFCAGLAKTKAWVEEETYKFVDKKSLAFFWDVMILTGKIRQVHTRHIRTHVGPDTPITFPSFSFQSLA